MKQKRKSENGSVVTEASIALPIFIIAVFLIINFVNILCLHNKIQFAINSTAHEIASYSYLDSALHIHQTLNDVSADGAAYTEPLDTASNDILECLESIQNLKDDVGGAVDKTKTAAEDIGNLVENPKETAIGAGYAGYDALVYMARSGIGALAVQGLIGKYLDDGFLKIYGVKDGLSGLSFRDSSVFNDEDSRMVDIVVKYDVDLKFFSFVLNSNKPKITIVQRVTVPAWLDGDGQKPPG